MRAINMRGNLARMDYDAYQPIRSQPLNSCTDDEESPILPPGTAVHLSEPSATPWLDQHFT